MLPLISVLAFSLSILAICWIYILSKSRLPPGPRGYPIIGNIYDLHTQELWRTANRWGRQFGELVGLTMLGTPFIFVERGEVAMELLHKRSVYYSDRPHLTMAGELVGMDALVPLTRSDRLKVERKLLNQALSPSTIKKWRPAVESEVLVLLQSLVQSPDDHVVHFTRLAGAVILNAVYGYHVQAKDDPLIHAAEELMRVSSSALEAGWLVDFFTFLKWIPGTRWRRLASGWRAIMLDSVNVPYEVFKNLPDDDGKRSSFCGTLVLSDLGQFTASPELEDQVKWMATSLYGPGSDTTVVVLTQFLMAMVLHPDIQRKAHEEIDQVIGRYRLPRFDDRDELRFVDCILKETMRWGTPVPLTPPHRLTQSDKYKDLEFPEGSLFNANIWSMLHDERVYSDPLQFWPERFVEKQKEDTESTALPPSDPYTYVFGFGRRRCPGMHFADQTLWLAIASLLACFEMQPFVDQNGETILPEVAFDGGVFRQPKPFRCRIALRHEGVLSLLQKGTEMDI